MTQYPRDEDAEKHHEGWYQRGNCKPTALTWHPKALTQKRKGRVPLDEPGDQQR